MVALYLKKEIQSALQNKVKHTVTELSIKTFYNKNSSPIKNSKMKKIHILITICSMFSQTLMAQRASINISTYNTGARFELRRAPFGNQTDILDSVKTMVYAQDTFEVKKNEVGRNFTPPSRDEDNLKIKQNKPSDTPKRLTDAEIAIEKEKVKKNEAKRSCIIDSRGLKGKIVLIDFDKNCDPAEKCLQAQRAGAFAAIVIYDNNKKDSINMVKSRVSDAVTIPCYSIIRQQGDSLRVMLPTKAAFFTPRPTQTQAFAQNPLTDQTLIQQKDKVQNTPEGINEGVVNKEVIELGTASNLKGLTANEWRISPNPTSQTATLSYYFTQTAPLNIEVFNAAGQLIKQYKLNNSVGTLDIDVGHWSNGVYNVRLVSDKQKEVKRLVVQH